VKVMHQGKQICNLSLKDALEELPQQNTEYKRPDLESRTQIPLKPTMAFEEALEGVLNSLSVGSKHFLTKKVRQ